MSSSPLPCNIGEIRGRTVRRYVRVSSLEQGWKYGLDGQNLTIDEAIGRTGLREVGKPFVDEQSAWRRSGERPALKALIAAAHEGRYQILAVAYFSRWSRDVEVALRIRRELHGAGVTLLFADEGFLSADDDAHERYLDEAVAAEKFSHRLSRTIRRTYMAKFERYGDQAGSPGLGFVRTPQPEARLAIDPPGMSRVVELFERYARGDISYRVPARQSGVAEGALRAILTNPLYNGWAVRDRRSRDERRLAAPLRADPPVSDDLWARVAAIRAERVKTAGRQRPKRVHLLAKRMFCTCGRAVSADTVTRPSGPHRRYRHEDCPRWTQGSFKAAVFEEPISAQVRSIRLTPSVLSRIRSLATVPGPPDLTAIREALERELARKAPPTRSARLRRRHTWPNTIASAARSTGWTIHQPTREASIRTAPSRGSRTSGSRSPHTRTPWTRCRISNIRGKRRTNSSERSWSPRFIDASSSRGTGSSVWSLRRRPKPMASRLHSPRVWLWRARRDSNPRPSGPQPDALSAELRAHAIRSDWTGGEGGIRTPGAGYPTQRFSKPPH